MARSSENRQYQFYPPGRWLNVPSAIHRQHTTGEQDMYPIQKTCSRRAILRGGMLMGIAFMSSACSLNQASRLNSHDTTGDNPLLCDVPWQGIGFSWLPDSIHIAYAGSRGLHVLNVKSKQQQWKQKLWPGYNYATTQLVNWSANGTRLVYVTNAALLVQNGMSGENIWSYRVTPSATRAVALSPDGTHLAFTQAQSSHPLTAGNGQIWNTNTQRLVAQFDELDAANILLWSPNSAYFVIANQNGSVQVHRGADGHLLWRYGAQKAAAPPTVLCWSPDSSALAFATTNAQGHGMLGIWDARSGHIRFQFMTTANLTTQNGNDKSISWSPDSTRMAFATSDQHTSTIVVCSSQTGQHLFTCQSVNGQVAYTTWSPNGNYLAAGNYMVGNGELAQGDNGDRSQLQFWDAHSGKALFAYQAPKNPDQLSWSPDSHSLAIITPKAYGILANKTCLSMCRYGYNDYALQVFRVA